MPRKAGGNAITVRDRAIKQDAHRSLQTYGDDLRWEILDRTRKDTIISIEKAVRGDPPFLAPQHWAIRLVLEAAKIVGAPIEINAAIFAQIGATPERAKQAVAVVEDAEGMDAHDRAAMAVAELMEYRVAFPERYQALAGELAS